MVNKIDSNFTGLRYALEVQGTPKVLPGSLGADAVWLELEPNSYSEFGGTTTLKVRNPIVANRQQRKGRVVDIEAKAGFIVDFTSDNMLNFMPGYFFAAWRKSATVEVDTLTGVTAYNATGPVFGAYDKTGAFVGNAVVGSLILATGFAAPGNNGLKVVEAVASGALSVTDTGIVVDASPAATAIVKVVGFQGASGDITVVAGAMPVIESTVADFTTLNLVPGQWMFIGGDSAGTNFINEANSGFARIALIETHQITLDKTQNTFVNDAGTAKTVQLFFGDMIKNENDPNLIIAQTYQFERSLASAGFEYLPGSYPNDLTVEMKSADKIELTMGFIALVANDVEFGDRKIGSFPDLSTDPNAYNTSTDLVRIRASEQGDATPLFAFIQTMSLKIANNVSPLKALGVLGAFDVTIGDFVVSGDITAYFSDIAAVAAVQAADTLTLDFALGLDNRAWVFDIPTLTFDKGLLNVTKDQPVTIPVGINAAEDQTYKTTLQAFYFAYAPDAASA